MSRAAWTLGLGGALLALMAAGGGGRDPLASAVWQPAAVLVLLLAAGLPVSRDGAWIRRALAVLVVVLVISALGANRVTHATDQAFAWSLALAPALALAAAGGAIARATGGSCAESAAPALAGASVATLAMQLAALAGWPLLGNAGGSRLGRPIGTFMDPNHLACALALVAGANAPLAGARGRGRLHLGLAVVAGLASLATRSRVAVPCIAALVIVEAWRRHRAGSPGGVSRRLRLAVAGGLVVAGLALAATLWSRRGEADAWTRPLIWAGAAPAVIDRPLLGLGPAGFQTEWPRFQRPVERGLSRFAKVATTPHGEWLRVPIEIGILGLLALAALALALRRRAGARARDMAPVLAAALPALLVHEAFHSPAFVAWLAAGLAVHAGGAGFAPASEALLPAGSRREAAAWWLGALVIGGAVARHLASASPDPAARAPQGDVAALVASARASGDGSFEGALEAAVLAERACERAPRDADAALVLARSLAALRTGAPGATPLGVIDRAYARAAELAPFDAWRRAEHAGVLARGGDAAGSLRAADAALALEPALSRARAWRVVALEQLGRAEEAASERARLAEAIRAARAASPAGYERDLVSLEADLAAAAGVR